MDLIVVENPSNWLDKVIGLGDSARDTVGFLPRQAFEEYALKGHIYAATNDDNLLGYILFREQGSTLVIVHLCVAQNERGTGVAKFLVDELFERNKYYISGMKLSCRRDYGIEGFWRSIGFMPIGEKPGRATAKITTLTTWYRTNPFKSNIFSLSEQNNSIKVVVDTNIVIDLCDGGNVESDALFSPDVLGNVTYYIAPDTLAEINKKEDPALRIKHCDFAKSYFEIIDNYDKNTYSKVKDELLSYKVADSDTNTGFDISHIAYAIACGAKVFVTNDMGWLNNSHSTHIFDNYGLLIESPGELIKSIDEICSPDAYEPQKLSGLDLEYSEMQHAAFSEVVDTFYSQYEDKKKATFERALRGWMANAKNTKLLLVKSVDKMTALVVYCICDNAYIVNNIFINKNTLKPSLLNTFVKRLAVKLIENAKNENLSKVFINKTGVDTSFYGALESCFFEDTGTFLANHICRQIVTFSDLPMVHREGTKSLVEVLKETYESPVQTTKDRQNILLQIEKALWPLKIVGENIPCYIVPIQPEYAKQLFDESLAYINPSLFSNEKTEPALSVENVYYKSERNRITQFPARILWYVSNGEMYGTKKIRACSCLDAVEVDTVSNLYKRYKRLGVLDWQDMLRIGSADQSIAAYKFSYTELLDKPVPLAEIRKILGRQETFQSGREISESQFFEIYKQGSVLNE